MTRERARNASKMSCSGIARSSVAIISTTYNRNVHAVIENGFQQHFISWAAINYIYIHWFNRLHKKVSPQSNKLMLIMFGHTWFSSDQDKKRYDLWYDTTLTCFQFLQIWLRSINFEAKFGIARSHMSPVSVLHMKILVLVNDFTTIQLIS